MKKKIKKFAEGGLNIRDREALNLKNRAALNVDKTSATRDVPFMDKTTTRVGPTVFGGRGTFDYKVKQKGYDSATPIYEQRYARRSRGGDAGRYLPITTPNVNPRAYYVQNNLIGYDATKTRGLNEAELNSIMSDQKRQIAKTKREASQEDNKTKRNKRGGGGLLSKAKPVEVKGLATAMPNLGVMSLYSPDSTLGVR